MRLAVDGGQTLLRMALVDDDGAVRRRVEVPGFSWAASPGERTGQSGERADQSGEPADPVAQQSERVLAAWDALDRPAPLAAIAVGLAGGGADTDSRHRLAGLLLDALPVDRVLATGDDVITHLGVLGGEPGVVVAAGTGTACIAFSADGGRLNVDGLGYLFGDAGSGFALGQAGIRAALAGLEGRGPRTVLTERAVERYGAPLRDLIKTLYPRPTLIAEVAGFAAAVIEAAEGSGPVEGSGRVEEAGPAGNDDVARALCADAGRDLATTVTAAVRRHFPGSGAGTCTGTGQVPVSWAGQILTGSRAVFDPFARGLVDRCPAAVLREPGGDAMAGAVRLSGIRPDTDRTIPHLSATVIHERGR